MRARKEKNRNTYILRFASPFCRMGKDDEESGICGAILVLSGGAKG